MVVLELLVIGSAILTGGVIGTYIGEWHRKWKARENERQRRADESWDTVRRRLTKASTIDASRYERVRFDSVDEL